MYYSSPNQYYSAPPALPVVGQDNDVTGIPIKTEVHFVVQRAVYGEVHL